VCGSGRRNAGCSIVTDLHSLHATRRQLKATITVMEKETGARTRPQRVLLLQALRDMERLYTDNIAAELRRERALTS